MTATAQFAASASHYDRFMGRYALSLAPSLADAAGVTPGMRVLDVGCGPGGLTNELCWRTGSGNVAAIDPAPQFVAACRDRHPAADVREGVAEQLPWPDAEFDVTLSSLVVGFMADPDRGIREMARVTRPGGTVAACMWDTAAGGMVMLSVFWAAARQLDPSVSGERRLAGAAEGDLVARFKRAGLMDVAGSVLMARADYAGFDDFWEPFTFAVGPAGHYLAFVRVDQRERVREACRAKLPDGAFSLDALAWCARGTAAKEHRRDQHEHRRGGQLVRSQRFGAGGDALGGQRTSPRGRLLQVHQRQLGRPVHDQPGPGDRTERRVRAPEHQRSLSIPRGLVQPDPRLQPST